MIKAHGCKKCQGTLLLDKDEFGWYEECIQCGYTRDIPLDVAFNSPLMTSPITVTVKSDNKNLFEKWKHDKIPAYQPIKRTRDVEDTY